MTVLQEYVPMQIHFYFFKINCIGFIFQILSQTIMICFPPLKFKNFHEMKESPQRRIVFSNLPLLEINMVPFDRTS